MDCKFIWPEPLRKRKRPKNKQAYTTIYPSNKILDTKFQSSEEVSAFLLRNADQIGYCKWQLFQKGVQDMGDFVRIVYSCRFRGCTACLVFNQRKVGFEKEEPFGYPKKYYLALSKINNRHSHPLKLTKKLASQRNIRQYLFDLPVQDKFENHLEVVKQKFNLTRCQTKYLKDRVFWRFKNEDHMLWKLAERKVSFRRKIDRENGKTSILLLISQTMKKNYLYYGDSLCFDITYKLIMRKKEERRAVGVGFFIGQDENSRIILFGLATIRNQSGDDFVSLFGFFFDIMGQPTETIITDDQRALGSALQTLKKSRNYPYTHLLDWYHKIQSLKNLIKRQPNREQLFTLMSRLLKESSNQVFLDIVKEIAELLEREDTMVQFFRDRRKCCLAQVPECFFGFGISSTRAEAFNNLIKRWVPHQTNIGRLIYFVLRVQKRLNNRMAVLNYIHPQLLTPLLPNPQLQTLSTHLESLTFEQLRQYHTQSLEFPPPSPTASPLHFFIPYRKYQREYRFNLMYDLRDGCWRCQCRNNFRTGLPCAHVVRAVREFGGCVGYYVNQRWLHAKGNAVVRKPTRPNIRTKKI